MDTRQLTQSEVDHISNITQKYMKHSSYVSSGAEVQSTNVLVYRINTFRMTIVVSLGFDISKGIESITEEELRSVLYRKMESAPVEWLDKYEVESWLETFSPKK